MQTTLNWVAVAIAAVTVAANIIGVRHASRTQRQIAHAERIGDKQTDTYLELLKWVKDITVSLEKTGLLDLAESAAPPSDLEIRITAFASSKVRQRVNEFQIACFQYYHRRFLGEDREQVNLLLTAAAFSLDFTQVNSEVPELPAVQQAIASVRDAIRQELLGEAAVSGIPSRVRGGKVGGPTRPGRWHGGRLR